MTRKTEPGQDGAETGAAGGKPAAPRAADRIRKTARELFYRAGIRAVGVEEIVTRAGVTKPSLYRSFPSKDELAAAYLRDYSTDFWQWFRADLDRAGSDDPRARLLAYFERMGKRASAGGYRGCGLTNAAIEYPEADHPARLVAQDHKAELRGVLRQMAAAMGARDPDQLGDALMLLIEGSFVTGQLFGEAGPAQAALQAATMLIDAATGTDAGMDAGAAGSPTAKPKKKKKKKQKAD
ncbi:TetR/AcrR family transcriptional regulator [Ferrovibrio sp.]|uniref:TetR/AcrR family transcriptional regulator n=1 Tax=Ferrovibrio sp. TaxID=1917215 RepID=UPI00311EDFA3